MSQPVVLIIQHDVHDKPCYFGTYLETHAIPYIVFHCYDAPQAAALPSSVLDTVHGVSVVKSEEGVVRVYHAAASADVDGAVPLRIAGVASLGGYMSVNDNLPYFETVFALYRSALEWRIPVIGHCLGGQLLSKALGGEVTASPGVELGWVQLNTQVAADEVHNNDEPIFDWFGEEKVQTVFEWHGETFSIPEGCVRLAASEQCPNQSFQVLGKPALGMQFHVEVERSKMDSWVAEGHRGLYATKAEKLAAAPELEAEGGARQSYASVMTQEEMFDEELFQDRLANSKKFADQIYQTWTSFLPLQ